MRNIYRNILFLSMVLLFVFTAVDADARGHDGFFMGGGVLTIPMISAEDRMTAPGGDSRRVTFLPGFGGWLTFGYDFPGTSWGIQMPVEYEYFKLNDQEWTSSIGSNVEAIWRLAQASNGFEFHLLGGLGWTYLFEGQRSNRSRSTGVNFEAGPGISWFFARGDTRASLSLETPLRVIYFFGDHLSAGGTTVFAFPIRLGVTVGF